MLLLACLVVGISLVTAQTQKVTGIVISEEDGQPIVGASVLVKGTSQGTITDTGGHFNLPNVPGSAKTLQVSYVGMQTQELAIKPNLKIVLKSDAQLIDEVMVVAYGTAKKSSFTGSAAVVDQSKISKIQSSDITKALEGTVAGVQISSSSGQPGSGTSIRIRGIGSINASSNPLIVVDGVPFDGDLSLISQQDVESMTVLKDAAANALYGARGANGVVLITTKKGKDGKATITVDAKWGANSRAIPEYNIMTDPAMYYVTAWQTLNNRYGATDANAMLIRDLLKLNVTDVPNAEIILPDGTFNPNAKIKYQDNWDKELFQNGLRQEYNINMNGGTEKTNYYMSFGYLNDEGYTVNSGFERFSGRLRLEHQFNEWFKMGGNFAYVNTGTQSMSADENQDQTAGSNLFYMSRVLAPIYPVYQRDASGSKMYDSKGRLMLDYGNTYGRPILSNTNPLGSQLLDEHTFKKDYFTGNMFAEVSFLRDFKFTFRAGLENDNEREVFFQNGEYGQFTAQNGIVSHAQERNNTVNLQELLTWGRSFQKHRIDVLVGHETYQTKYERLYASKNNFALLGTTSMDLAVSNPQAGSRTSEYSTEGYLGRVEYNYSDKYYVSGSYRRDASSVFHPDYRWGNFWSVGASWRVKEEAFLKDVEWINSLKFKISYGSQGNDFILNTDNTRNRYAYQDHYGVSNNNGNPALTQIFKGNEKLKWETNYNFNTGFEFAILNNRLSGSFEFFSRYAKDLLFNRPLVNSTGVASYPDNIGDMRNTGVELDLNANIIQTRDINWSVAFNMTHYKNTIKSLPPEKKVSGIWDANIKMVEGGSVYDFWTKKYAGVDPETGKSQWYMDVTDADGKVTGQEKTDKYSLATDYKIGSALPTIYGGISTTLDLYGFDLSIGLTYQVGGKGYDAIYQGLMHGGSSRGENFHKDILNAWTPENKYTDVPQLYYGDSNINATSDRFLVKASYLNLQNISLGYTLPRNWTEKFKCQGLRVYLIANNVALLSGRKGYDPRTNWTGESKYNYSAIRTISGGVTVKF